MGLCVCVNVCTSVCVCVFYTYPKRIYDTYPKRIYAECLHVCVCVSVWQLSIAPKPGYAFAMYCASMCIVVTKCARLETCSFASRHITRQCELLIPRARIRCGSLIYTGLLNLFSKLTDHLLNGRHHRRSAAQVHRPMDHQSSPAG